MRKTPWNEGWLYTSGKPRHALMGAGEAATPVTLPHDAQIGTDTYAEAPGGTATGFYGGGAAVYTKHFDAPAEWQGQQVMLQFDGAYQNAEVVVNGHLAAIHHYGYTPFVADLTPYLYFHRPNRVEVTVNNTAQPNSRWYSGTGLYREVALLVSPAVHIAPWGVFARTERVQEGTAFVMAEITVVNPTDRPVEDRVQVSLAPEGGAAIADNFMKFHVAAGSEAVVRVPLTVKNAPLWDPEDPQLCTVTATVGGDEASTGFGIRTLSWDVVHGMQVNGKTVKLRGGCVHHDNGTLGAASFYDSEYRKMKLHRDNGYNAIRTAHNPPSAAMLEACDRLGLMVMDEAFDAWRIGKVTNDYHLYFESDWQSDLAAVIRRDRNHPCVVMWSSGNEITERAGLSGGNRLARELADFIRALDSSRPVTNGICSMWSGLDDEQTAFLQESYSGEQGQNVLNALDRLAWDELTEGFAAPLDIVGYNYYHERYEGDGKKYPNRVMVGSESAPMKIADIWAEVEKFPYVLGDFTWTSYDYLGEAGIGRGAFAEPGTDPRMAMALSFSNQYPWRTAQDADFDICGFDRPQLHYRKVVWGSDETYILVHDPAGYGKQELLSQWSWPLGASHWSWAGYEGRPVKISVYSRAEEVELLCNGVSLGRAVPEKFTAGFETVYAPGILTAVSYTGGAEVSRHELTTAGPVAGLKCSAEPGVFAAGGQSLAFVTIEAVDAAGRRVPTAELPATAAVTGAATLQAFASARPATAENYTTGSFTSYEGRWQAVLRAGAEAGPATLRVEAEGFAPAELTLTVR